jgi:hypothetical protein
MVRLEVSEFDAATARSGLFVPAHAPQHVPGFAVLQGMVALTQIGAEFKIVATAHLKQIDRVITDLTGSAVSLKAKNRANTIADYAAALVRIAHQYDERF